MSMIVSISQKTALIQPLPWFARGFGGARDRNRCLPCRQAPVVRSFPDRLHPARTVRAGCPRSKNCLTHCRALFTPGANPHSRKAETMAAYQYIYVMKGLGKTYP